MSDVFKTGRETIYKGVKMRSRLEAGFAMWLDARETPWKYEPCAFGSSAGQYLPDFHIPRLFDVRLRTDVSAYVDVKPKSLDPVPVADTVWGADGIPNTLALARQMAVIWDSEPDAALLIVWPGLLVSGGQSGVLRVHKVADADVAAGEPPHLLVDYAWLQTKGSLALLAPWWPAAPWPDGYWSVK